MAIKNIALSFILLGSFYLLPKRTTPPTLNYTKLYTVVHIIFFCSSCKTRKGVVYIEDMI